MAVLLYRPPDSQAGERLQNAIKTELSGKKTEIYHSIKELAERLIKRDHNGFIAVLLADSIFELMELLMMEELLKDIRIILVLPDRSAETVSTGHKLRPRFLSYADGNFSDVAAVLKKMVQLSDSGSHNDQRNTGAIN